jgi:hypothetical protein
LDTECFSGIDACEKELNEKQEDTKEEGEDTKEEGEDTFEEVEATSEEAKVASEETEDVCGEKNTNEEGTEAKEVEIASVSSNELMQLATENALVENNVASLIDNKDEILPNETMETISDNNLEVVENTEELIEVGETLSEASDIPVEENDTLTDSIGNTSGISNDEFDALCKIVEAEAGGEGEQGKLLVANVVLNRVANESFPNSITEVITASGQFTPVSNGSYQNAVATPETVIAVNRALAGENVSMGALYFKSENSSSDWSSKTLLFSYGNHNFYL